jgi:hypothetical protein
MMSSDGTVRGLARSVRPDDSMSRACVDFTAVMASNGTLVTMSAVGRFASRMAASWRTWPSHRSSAVHG